MHPHTPEYPSQGSRLESVTTPTPATPLIPNPPSHRQMPHLLMPHDVAPPCHPLLSLLLPPIPSPMLPLIPPLMPSGRRAFLFFGKFVALMPAPLPYPPLPLRWGRHTIFNYSLNTSLTNSYRFVHKKPPILGIFSWCKAKKLYRYHAARIPVF